MDITHLNMDTFFAGYFYISLLIWQETRARTNKSLKNKRKGTWLTNVGEGTADTVIRPKLPQSLTYIWIKAMTSEHHGAIKYITT